jgi:hypothetical protein
LLLRIVVMMVIVAGLVALNNPLQAISCVAGGACDTETSTGHCGNPPLQNACDCFGSDGSVVRNDFADCFF